MATPAGANQPKQEDSQTVRIWDDPESRIHFLETVMKGKEWEAIVYHPDFAPDGSQRDNPTPLPELAAKLAEKGYKTVLGRDENGIPILTLRRFGSDTTLVSSMRELGFVSGMAHKVGHIGQPLGDLMRKSTDMLKHVASDKARLIGGLYLVGDLVLIFAGLGNKKATGEAAGESAGNALSDPANLLQSAAGVAATLQSLIYMGFAKEGSEATLAELMHTAEHAEKNGQSLLDSSAWQQRASGPKGLLGLPQKALGNYPIQIGAITQVAGQVALLGSGGIRLQRGMKDSGPDADSTRRGAMQDMLTALTSAMGWALLSKPKTGKIDDADKHPWSDPRRVWQEMSEKPNQYASGFMTIATAAGIAAGRTKGNNIQQMGNLTYLLGDGIMFMTDSDNYGAAAKGNSAMLADAAEQFIKASPLVLGEQEQAQFVQNLAAHLAERSLYDDAKKQKRGNVEISGAQITELANSIADDLTAKLPRVNERANETAARIAHVVTQLPPSAGAEVTEALCDAVSQLDGVAISKDELKSHVERQTEYGKTVPAQQVKMDDVAKPLADLLFSIPGAASAATVDKLFNTVEAYIRPEPQKGKQALETAINQKAAADVAAATASDKAAAPVVGAHTAALATQQGNGHSLNR